jgi:hypothetical protein
LKFCQIGGYVLHRVILEVGIGKGSRVSYSPQIILPTVEEMLEVQKQVLEILQNFEKNFKNW